MTQLESFENSRMLNEEATRRKVRLLMLLDAADYASISPIPTGKLHAFAYLADVLSPIYGLLPTRGHILKRRSGPYYPDFQQEVDRLVGLGLVDVANLRPAAEENRKYIDAEFFLVRSRASYILNLVNEDGQFADLREFFRSVAEALGAIAETDLDDATREDVTWSGNISGSLIDFGEWRARNLSVPSANMILNRTRNIHHLGDSELTAGAALHLYVRYLKRAANG